MKRKYQYAFFLFGLASLALMATQLKLSDVTTGLRGAGTRFPAVMLLWAVLYVFNTVTWYIIIQSGGRIKINLLWLYKLTVSGFALNYATPGGLMGGEPYRIMALAPVVGTERASSSVILYSMTHIYSHFWFWTISVALFLITQPITPLAVAIATAVTVFCLAGLWLFKRGYRNGLAVATMNFLGRMPLAGKWARGVIERHRDKLDTIDQQTTALRGQNKRSFRVAVLTELACRVCSAAEIFLILSLIRPDVNYVDCILILAFTSLFANLLFFMPMQIGGREGGFLMSVAGLGMTAGAGIFTALIIRLRELLWTGIGLLLINVERKQKA